MTALHFFMPPYMPTRTLTSPSFTFCGNEVLNLPSSEKISKPWDWHRMVAEDRADYSVCLACEEHWRRHQAVAHEEEAPGYCTCHFCSNPPTI
jgi:hypothetical protein